MKTRRGPLALTTCLVFAAAITGCGNKNSNPEGKSGGKTLTFEYLHYDRPDHKRIAEAVQTMLKKELGAEVSLLAMDPTEMRTQKLQPHKFQAGYVGWGGDYPNPMTFLSLKRSSSVYNYSGWNNPDYDRLTWEGFTTLDATAANAKFTEAERQLLEAGVVIPVLGGMNHYALKPYVRGIYPNATDHYPFRWVRIHRPGPGEMPDWVTNPGRYLGTVKVPDANLFRVCTGNKPGAIDPQRQEESWGIPYTDAMFEGLTAFSPKTLWTDPESGQPLPGVAEAWDVSADGKTIIFHLRADSLWVKPEFKGGKVTAVKVVRPVKAHDFVFAWQEQCLGPQAQCPYKQLFDEVQYDGMEAKDDRTLVVRYKNASGISLPMTGFSTFLPVYPEAVKHHKDGWVLPENIVVNGAYVLETMGPTSARLVRNPHYWWWKTQPDASEAPVAIEATFSTNRQGMQDTYAAGDLEFMGIGCRLVDAFVVKNHATYADIHMRPAIRTWYIELNANADPFNDPRVRQAIAYAIDRVTLARILELVDKPAGVFVPDGLGGSYHGAFQYQYDPEKARQLLRAAGYKTQ